MVRFRLSVVPHRISSLVGPRECYLGSAPSVISTRRGGVGYFLPSTFSSDSGFLLEKHCILIWDNIKVLRMCRAIDAAGHNISRKPFS